MTYVIPDKPVRPFDKGDIVDVMSREGIVLKAATRIVKKQTIKTFIGKAHITVFIEDGRQFDAKTGHWVGTEGSYPFPWIRYSK
jgi:hypothetical protein